MKISVLSLITASIFIGLFSIVYYNTQAESSVNEIKKQYAVYVTAACRDAVTSADKLAGGEENIFDGAEGEAAVNTFFKSLETSFNRIGMYAEEIELYVPALVLIDKDGFYVYYNAGIDEAVSSAGTFISAMTELKTWTESIGNYVVRYRLSDIVTVTNTLTGEIFTGNRTEAYSKFSDSSLAFLNDTSEFEDRKGMVIIRETGLMTEYYINNQNNYNKYDSKYKIDLSLIGRNEWDELLKSPNILAFLQGKQLREAENNIILNIYSFAGTEVVKPLRYFIDDNNMYHCMEQLEAVGEVVCVDGEYYYAGEHIEHMHKSMEECAEHGAYPAPLR